VVNIAISNNGVLLDSPANIRLETASGPAYLNLSFVVTEGDATLTQKTLSVAVNYGDGALPVNLAATSSPVSYSFTRAYLPGTYAIVVSARNYKFPTPDTQVEVVTLTVVSTAPVNAVEAAVLFGPILPRDSGFPNSQQWNIDRGTNILVLESSVRMLLLTSVGERVMNPTYGTNLRSLIFSLDSGELESAIHTEIVSAIASFEPRVELQTFTYTKTGSAANVSCSFRSKLSNQTFSTNLQFVSP